MYSHQPPGYECPFCLIAAGEDSPLPWTQAADVFWRTEHLTAFVNARWWPNNPGATVVIPNRHIESLYDLTPDIAVHVHEGVRQVAIALKQVYRCDGISTRQHNEPAGNQDVWHYHVHVFPRYHGDDLYTRHADRRTSAPEERLPYAGRLRSYFATRGQ